MKYRGARGGSGRVVMMITQWSNGTWDAEVYPHSGKIIAEAKSLDTLLTRLKGKRAMKDALSVAMEVET